MQVERWPCVAARQDGLEHRQVAVAVPCSGLDQDPRPALDPLALARAAVDRVGEGSAAVGRRVELVEALGVLVAAVAAGAEHVAEPHARRVDVQEDRGCVARVAKGVDDVGRSPGEGAGSRAHRVKVGTRGVRLAPPSPLRNDWPHRGGDHDARARVAVP